VAAALATVVLAAALAFDVVVQSRGAERASRNFYGVLRVVREEPGWPDEHLRLLHGRISHGTQLVAPARRGELTTYYGPASGVGSRSVTRSGRRAADRSADRPGAGTLAAWSGPGTWCASTSRPEWPALPRGGRSRTCVTRRRGERRPCDGASRAEPPQRYDVLVVDAFSSDAIPTHLLTREAFGVYLRHLAEGGALAVHVTNRYLDLKPVVRGAAAELRLQAEHVPSVERSLLWSSDWMLVAPGPTFFEDEVVSAATLPRLPRADEVLWTDDWSNLLRVVKR
jgi:hypothetical protein